MHRLPDDLNVRPRMREDGFSLVLVLLVVGALSLASVLFLQTVRGYSRTAASAVSVSMLEAYADAGVQIAILDLASSARDGRRTRRVAIDGTPFLCTPGGGVALRLRVQDDAGRVDLNVASDRLIQALVRGLPIEKPEAVADAILDYRDSDNDRRPSGAEAEDYAKAGRTHGPRNAAFLSIEELGQVLGVGPGALALLRPHLTLNSGLEGLDAAVARPDLVEIIVRGDAGGRALSGPSLGARPSLPQEMSSTSMRRTFTIEADARTAAARYVRQAAIELTSSRTRPYIVRGWTRGEADGSAYEEAAALPPC